MSEQSDFDRLERDVEALQAEMHSLGVRSALLEQRVDTIRCDIAVMRDAAQHHSDDTDARFVPLARYTNVEKIVYGMVGLILATVLTVVLAQVLQP